MTAPNAADVAEANAMLEQAHTRAIKFVQASMIGDTEVVDVSAHLFAAAVLAKMLGRDPLLFVQMAIEAWETTAIEVTPDAEAAS